MSNFIRLTQYTAQEGDDFYVLIDSGLIRMCQEASLGDDKYTIIHLTFTTLLNKKVFGVKESVDEIHKLIQANETANRLFQPVTYSADAGSVGTVPT